MKTKAPRAVAESTWKKMHAEFVKAPDYSAPIPWSDTPDLEDLAKRFKVPLAQLQQRASNEDWKEERADLEARAYFETAAPGIKSEVAFCLDYASRATKTFGVAFTLGGEDWLAGILADARVIWRRRMGAILLWEAILASPKYARRTAA